jgi:AICAR transformylase/IMP cyclohydrolase PurH
MLERLSGPKAFALLSRYDAEIADYFEQLGAETQEKEVPPHIDLSCSLLSTLRYGENRTKKQVSIQTSVRAGKWYMAKNCPLTTSWISTLL